MTNRRRVDADEKRVVVTNDDMANAVAWALGMRKATPAQLALEEHERQRVRASDPASSDRGGDREVSAVPKRR